MIRPLNHAPLQHVQHIGPHSLNMMLVAGLNGAHNTALRQASCCQTKILLWLRYGCFVALGFSCELVYAEEEHFDLNYKA